MIPTPVDLYYDPEHPSVRILNISDAHLGAADFARKDLRECLCDNMADPNTYLLTNGDMMDCITVRDKRFEMGGIAKEYLSMRPDEILDLQVEDITSELEPYKDRIIGLGMGNHERKIVTEFSTNAHRRVCNNLGVKNLGYSSILTPQPEATGCQGSPRPGILHPPAPRLRWLNPDRGWGPLYLLPVHQLLQCPGGFLRP